MQQPHEKSKTLINQEKVLEVVNRELRYKYSSKIPNEFLAKKKKTLSKEASVLLTFWNGTTTIPFIK